MEDGAELTSRMQQKQLSNKTCCIKKKPFQGLTVCRLSSQRRRSPWSCWQRGLWLCGTLWWWSEGGDPPPRTASAASGTLRPAVWLTWFHLQPLVTGRGRRNIKTHPRVDGNSADGKLTSASWERAMSTSVLAAGWTTSRSFRMVAPSLEIVALPGGKRTLKIIQTQCWITRFV